MTLKTWLRLHRYLGVFSAPLIVFLAVSGAWQVWELHRSTKDGRYSAPRALATGSNFHMAHRAKGKASDAFRALVTLVAGSLAVTAGIGVGVAFRLTPRRSLIWTCLLAGAALPLCAYLFGSG